MLELYSKATYEKVDIYHIDKDSNGYPKFLVRVDNQWVWKSAKHYITKDEVRDLLNKTCIAKCEYCINAQLCQEVK